MNTIEDIEQMIRELPASLYADGTEARARSAGRAAELLNRIAAALSPAGEALWRGSTLIVSNIDPLLVFGRRTYLHDVLSAMGGVNAVTARGWVELTLEDVLRLEPEAIIIVREDQESAAIDPMEAAGVLATLQLPAVRENRIAVLAHPDVNLPSSGIGEVAAEMKRVLRALAESSP